MISREARALAYTPFCLRRVLCEMGETLAGEGGYSASNLDAAAECFLLALVSPSPRPDYNSMAHLQIQTSSQRRSVLVCAWQSSFRRDGRVLKKVRRACVSADVATGGDHVVHGC